MSAADFRALLAAWGWTQRGLAGWLGLAHNTVHRWALGQARIPDDVVVWLRSVGARMEEAPRRPR
jgi:hypothetical protein